MKYKITYSDAFKKHYKKLSDIEKAQTKKKINLFVENPYHPSCLLYTSDAADDLLTV